MLNYAKKIFSGPPPTSLPSSIQVGKKVMPTLELKKKLNRNGTVERLRRIYKDKGENGGIKASLEVMGISDKEFRQMDDDNQNTTINAIRSAGMSHHYDIDSGDIGLGSHEDGTTVGTYWR